MTIFSVVSSIYTLNKILKTTIVRRTIHNCSPSVIFQLWFRKKWCVGWYKGVFCVKSWSKLQIQGLTNRAISPSGAFTNIPNNGPSLLNNYWSLHPVNLVLTDIRTEIPITVSIIEVFSRVSAGQCFDFQNYTVFSRACTQNNKTESSNRLKSMAFTSAKWSIFIFHIYCKYPETCRQTCPDTTATGRHHPFWWCSNDKYTFLWLSRIFVCCRRMI